MTDPRNFYFFANQGEMDPTRTLTLRDRWVTDWNRRIAALDRMITVAMEKDYFDLEVETSQLAVMAVGDVPAPAPRQFSYRWSHEKVQEFMSWLNDMEDKTLLEVTQRPGTLRPPGEPWSNLYVRSAYQKGLEYARTNVNRRSAELARQMNLDVPLPPAFRPSGGAISAVMQQPFHADRLALAYTRVFDELKGVTRAMDQQISRVLTTGIAEGLNPREIGKNISDRVDKIGRTRGTLIARTETINIHAQAALNEYYSIEKSTGEVVLVQWKATMDNRTRLAHAHLVDPHRGYNGLVMTKEEAYTRIGEPNCRCALLPYIPATQGMPSQATAAARKRCAAAIADLSEREKALVEKEVIPKEEMSPREAALSAWEEAKKSSGGKRTAPERVAFYQFVPHMTESEYASARKEVIDRLLGHTAKAKKNQAFYEKAHEGLAIFPIDLLDRMGSAGYKIIYRDGEARAHFLEIPKTCNLFRNSNAITVSHEFAHAVDHFFSGRRSTGLEWMNTSLLPKVPIRDAGKDLLREYGSLVARKNYTRGTYTNGDGEYWKDNWIDDYEGRIYKSYFTGKESTGVEWWSMNQQYFHQYQSSLGARDTLISRYKKQISEGVDQETKEYLETKLGNLEKISSEEYAELGTSWALAKRRYPVLTKFIESNFGVNKRLIGKW